MEDIIEQWIFNSKKEFRTGMDEIKHFTPPCEYEYKFFECTRAFPNTGKRIHYGVNVIRRATKTMDFCSECEFNNNMECNRPEEE